MRAASDLVQASLLLSVLVAELGCAPKHRPPGEAGAAGPPVEGRVAYEILPDPSVTPPPVSSHQVLMAPLALEHPLPDYPEQALVKNAAPVTLAVRIVIDETGVVREVLDSPLEQRPIGADRGVYRQAAEEAVRHWKFKAATVRTLADGEDLDHDGKIDYTVVVDEKPVRSYLDLRFTFEVVNGRGRVVAGPGT